MRAEGIWYVPIVSINWKIVPVTKSTTVIGDGETPQYFPSADGVPLVGSQKPVYARADPSRDGCACRVCRAFYPYAEADGSDGLLTCTGCAQLAGVFA